MDEGPADDTVGDTLNRGDEAVRDDVRADIADDDAIDLRRELRKRRAETTLRERLAEPDRYGLVLILILGAMFAIALLDQGPVARVLSIVVLGCTVLFTLRTSRAPRRLLKVGAIAVPVLVVAATIIATLDSVVAAEIVSVVSFVLIVCLLGAILRRITVHMTVSGSTVLAGLCIYLLIGLTFATVFSFMTAWGDGLFVQTRDPSSTDVLYFSYITMTTVGYGDLTPASNLAKMLSATEALAGQIYLVTAVALLVGNLGRQRRRLRRDE
jgi:hypothetical protein